jgi:single-strand DNA-binding protein
MTSLNRVILLGNLTRDPEVRYTPSGTAVGDLRLAVSRKFKTAEGENKEETCFVGVTVWGRQAETCAEYLSKGSPALIEGRLKYDEWEKDGQKQNRLTVVAERVQFVGGGRGGAEARGEAPAGRPAGQGQRQVEPAAEQPPAPPPAPAAAEGMQDDDNLPF